MLYISIQLAYLHNNSICMSKVMLLFDLTTFKMAMKPVKLKEENIAGCAGEGKLSKGK